jgi:hypothetical protein
MYCGDGQASHHPPIPTGEVTGDRRDGTNPWRDGGVSGDPYIVGKITVGYMDSPMTSTASGHLGGGGWGGGDREWIDWGVPQRSVPAS